MKGCKESIPYYLALHRIPKLGPKQILNLLDRYDSVESLFNAKSSDLKSLSIDEATINNLQNPSWRDVEYDLEWLSKANHKLLTYFDSDYPHSLKQITSPPFLLFIIGDQSLLQSEQISIVGSRKPTINGKRLARKFSFEISTAGFTITSGLAYGIDYESHLGAIEASGRTIAVLGNGIDTIYPPKHRSIADSIAETGAIVSEFPTGVTAQPQNFPRRNRIISGLSLGTLVVEAAKRSGSLITAKYALDQGREVFALPGSILNPMSSGCHSLLKQGAKLVENPEDIYQEIKYQINILNKNLQLNESNVNEALDIDINERKLLEFIGFEPISIDELVTESGLTTGEVCSMLLSLELSGKIQSQLGGSYIRIS